MSRQLYRCFYYCLLFILLILLVTILILIDPLGVLLDIRPQFHNIPFPKSFTGPLEANNILSSAQKLFENQIQGPESIAIYNGSVFTSACDGYIYKIDGNDLKPVIKLIKNECPYVWNKTSCGRPLGLKFDSKGVLYVVEPNHGIYTVEDVLSSTPVVKQVFDISNTSILGKVSKLLDDIVIDESGGENGENILYISDSSSKYDLSEMLYLIQDSDTGRLIRYNTVTQKLDTAISGLLFPNGIELTDDKSAILLCEVVPRRILKHFIRGPKAGQTLILVSQLPGEPDNIRRSSSKNETYWVAITMARNEANLHLNDRIQKYPLVRKFIFRVIHLVGSIIEFIGDSFSWTAIRTFGFGIRSGSSLIYANLNNKYGMVIEVDINGTILRSLHSPEGSVTSLSEAKEVTINDTDSVLYLGSYFNHYLGKLYLKNRVNI